MSSHSKAAVPLSPDKTPTLPPSLESDDTQSMSLPLNPLPSQNSSSNPNCNSWSLMRSVYASLLEGHWEVTLGKMEFYSKPFLEAVRGVFDSEILVFGVVPYFRDIQPPPGVPISHVP